MNERVFEVIDLGRRSYLDALELQRALRLRRIDGSIPHDMLVLVEHDPVFTLGRGTRTSSLPVAAAELRRRGADVVEIERGGDVTWHGPGQLVGYPIVHLGGHREDLHWYLRTLEQVIIDALGALGIDGQRVGGKTGVWTGERKIASLGIHVKQWVTMHGFALNIDPDLSWFDLVVPCGLDGVRMTSVVQELAERAPTDPWRATRDAVVTAFGAAFGLLHVDTPEPLR